ncbi:hypothetical protein ACRAKI_12345 [Saccharothrix isguenensis]
MPDPMIDPPHHGGRHIPEPDAAGSRHTAADGEVALTLPSWDLLPPVEFLNRRRGREPGSR